MAKAKGMMIDRISGELPSSFQFPNDWSVMCSLCKVMTIAKFASENDLVISFFPATMRTSRLQVYLHPPAWLVVEKLAEQGYFLSLECDENSSLWRVIFFKGRVAVFAAADTAPLAICLAALQISQGVKE